MRIDRCGLILALLLPLLATAATPDEEYAYSFSLQTPAKADAYRVRFNPDIYAASWPQAELQDIVVVDAEGNSVPFASVPVDSKVALPFILKRRLLPLPDSAQDDSKFLRVLPAPEHGTRGFIIAPQLERSAISEHPKRWLADAGERVVLTHIDIESGLDESDFELHIAVDTSDDLQSWRTAVTDATVLSLRGDVGRVQKRRIKMDHIAARYYRLRVVKGDPPWLRSKPPEITLVGKTMRVALGPEPPQTLTVQSVPDDAPAGIYEYHLPAVLPLQSLQLVLSDPVSAASARVSVRDPFSEQEQWRNLTTINAIRVPGRISGKAIFSRPQRVGRLRVSIDTDLSQPPQLKVSWRPDMYVFLAQGQGPYRLLAGSRTARRGSYPIAAALDQLRHGKPSDWQPPLATPGPRMQAGGPSAFEAPLDWSRIVLWLVLVAGALLVIGLAVSLLRKRS